MRPPDSWSSARVTLALSLTIAAVWIVLGLLRLDQWAQLWGGFIPGRLALDGGGNGAPVWLTPLTATLVHANFIHVAFGLLFLVVCGRPTEAATGAAGLALLFLAGAYAAAAAYYLVDPGSLAPMIGASGAVSAVVGAYAILFGRNKVKLANSTLGLWLNILWLMAAWLAIQLIVVFTFAGLSGAKAAAAADAGGFLVGLAFAYPLLLFRYRKA